MKPTIMYVRTSENCNANCFMCHFANQHGLYNITEEQFDMLLDKMMQEGTYRMIRFTGGEPLLHPNIISFISKAKEAGFLTSIITNGLLLNSLSKKLCDCKLDQIIISIDGSTPDIHDKLRGVQGLHNKIIAGVKEIKRLNPKVNIRANTVVSPLNIGDLVNLYNLLDNLNFDSWSIIPIRPTDDPNTQWDINCIDEYMRHYEKFVEEQKKNKKIVLLGYSQYWAGKTKEEITAMFSNKYRVTPKSQCNTVDLIRFYIPDKNLLVPCNCVAHRIHQIDVDFSKESDIFKQSDIMSNWLRENAPTHCDGCEPLNAFIGENAHALKDDVFKY